MNNFKIPFIHFIHNVLPISVDGYSGLFSNLLQGIPVLYDLHNPVGIGDGIIVAEKPIYIVNNSFGSINLSLNALAGII